MDDSGTEFAREARLARTGFLRELWQFLNTTKKWWLAPVIVFLLLLGALIFLGGTAAGPFIYTFF